MIESTLNYDDVAQMWRGLAHDRKQSLKGQGTAIAVLRNGWVESPDFYGATVAEMTDRVDNGWEAPGMKLPPGTNAQPRRKMRYSEEGELQIDLALSGHDFPFLEWKPRKRTPGIRLALGYNARGSVPAEVIAAYAKWSAELIEGLQNRGVDLEIGVFSTVRMTCGVVRANVRVKRFGRKSSLKTWGSLFSPSGYRMLGFTARMMACSENGKVCDPDMGTSVSPGWGVSFDPKTRTLRVDCDSKAERFPRERMDDLLKQVLKQI